VKSKIISGGTTMARMKTLGIEAKLDEKFKIEVKAGEHIMYVDQTKAGGGTDAGPTPLEYFFASLAGCIGTIARIIANQKRITLNGMGIKVEGAYDVETLLGKSKENRAGFNGIKVTLNIDSDMSKEDKEAFVHEIECRCPVTDNIANTTPIAIEVV
jgi:putative redox protein